MAMNQGTVKWATLSATALFGMSVLAFTFKGVNAYAEFMGKQRDIVRDVNDLREGQEQIMKKLDALGHPVQERRSPTR